MSAGSSWVPVLPTNIDIPVLAHEQHPLLYLVGTPSHLLKPVPVYKEISNEKGVITDFLKHSV
jgi:hypothetical protein